MHKLHNECREKLQAFCHKHGIKSDSPTDIDNVSMALAAMNYEPDLRTVALNLAQAAIIRLYQKALIKLSIFLNNY